MLFAIICTDKPNSLQIRLDKRQEHRAYLEALNEAGSIAFSGPFISVGGVADGSLIVTDVEDLAAAKSVAENDPYSKHGLFQDIQVRQWNWGMNAPTQNKR
ncbi:hypothetical protein DPM33_04480 [Mesorhizobium hawassense]|uniref:YCII-related domain-containing protein n=1 Tax=Mesorhizobium hawassense TaxID=1209954 RepID=A0A330HXL7_9HYPH|nr:YciI family protein [Mesorhizobium hawassense]RAZ91754.1 hypothetical protein DPM33_04480 [Mesorhizobium hawassense]